jgi:signal transduction histidine kinase
MGMRERARHFGGEVSIASKPGQGTRVALRLPVGV